MSLASGEQLGPYKILSQIGKGGMGEVWKARDMRLNRIVAVKRLTGRHIARFEQEARAIAALNHPHICQIHDIGTTPDGFSYLVLEYVDGKPLCGPFPVEEAVRLAVQIASALAEAHSKGILHRDLKPGNILLTASGSTKLLDFGLARLGDEADSEATKTIEGMVMGTAAYMAPEQAQGQPLDERSDIFSFGAVLYEMFSGRRAFPGEHALTTIAAVIHKEPEPLQAAPDIVRIVTRCLRKSPAERFQSVTDLRAALESARISAPRGQPSIAVLPFANMSGDKEQEYFSDGLAEEIINELVKIPGLRVIARTSAFAFKGQNTDIRRIAEALGVAHILEGSVRRSGNRIRVTAQLITAADGSHLWSERYDRELADVFEVQDEIAAAVAKALQAKLAPDPDRPPRYTPKLAAHEALLKARHHHWKGTPEAMARAEEFYKQAIELDPQYALAHAAYADYLIGRTVLGLSLVREMAPLVRAEVQKTLALDPSLPDGHAMLGIMAAIYDYDWKEADRHCSRALADDALSPWMRVVCGGFFLLAAGRMDEALEQQQRALLGDPLHPGIRVSCANGLMAAGRLDEAEKHLRHILDFDPSFSMAHSLLAGLDATRGMYQEAISRIEKASSPAGGFPLANFLLAGLLQRTGQKQRGENLFAELASRKAPGTANGMMYYYLITSDLDRAASWAENAIEERHPGIAYSLQSLIAKPLRESLHWPRLAKLMNLPGAGFVHSP